LSSIDLVLLGFLAKKPSSAYDLAKHLTRYDLGGFVRLSTPAVYKNLKNLEQKGFLSSEEIRTGEMPEKTVYSVNQTGREYFYSLAEELTRERVRYQFDFNSVILNLDKLPKSRREQYLQKLKIQITDSRKEMEETLVEWKNVSPMAEVLLQQVTLVNEALLKWIAGVEKKMESLG